jgi:hypothetical protein
LEVKIWYCVVCASGDTLAEVREDFLDQYADYSEEIPALLELPPPEVEDMHEVTGYDS